MCSLGVSLAFTVHILLVFSYGNGQVEPNVLVAPHGNGTRVRGFNDRVEKDFVLAGLFPVHGTQAGSSGGRCGEIRHEAGIEYAEAMLFALDRINLDPVLLPNLTLGYDLRDTCYSENIGLDEALDLIITGTKRQILSCNANSGSGNTNSSEQETAPPTFGIIGPTASGVSVHVASLARLFEIPQVSSASSSALLSNRDKFSFFYRTIPPDNFQAKVIISVLLHFNWTHISVVYSNNAYGSSGKDEIATLAKENRICIDLEEGISTDFQDDDFSELAATLDNSTARVVVAFITSADAGKLLKAMVTRPSFANITWIASDDWSEANSVLANFDGHSFGGVLGIVPAAQHVDDLHSYLTQLTIAGNTRNPWFAEYFSARTGCDLDTSCSVNMSVSESSQRHLLPLVIDAVYSLAYALDNFLKENCNQPLVWYRENMTCAGQQRELNGTNILAYLKSVSFVSPTGNEIEFDNQGNIKNASYSIVNYQVNTDQNGTYGHIVDIGLWGANGSTLEDDSIGVLQFYENSVVQFGTYDSGQVNHNSPVSECGRCRPGQKHVPVTSSCCGVCKSCLGQEYSDVSQAPGCKNCSDFGEFWGNNPLVGSDRCVQIKEAFLSFSNPYSIVMTVVASLGLLSVIFVSVTFGLHWNTPVVKSSSREQMVLLLIGISVSFLVACSYVAPPVLSVCIAQRIGLWFCYSLIFGALLIKVIRIARIFLRKSLTRPKYSETHYQILFTLLIVVGQMLIVTASVAYERPSIHRHLRLNKINNDNFPEVVITCEKDPLLFLILSVIYESALIATMTILGVVSFKFPANFNEAKHVSFCTFAVVIIWVGFIPSYFATQHAHEYQDAIIAMAVVISAIATLICVFGPRLFIIIFWPQKNSIEYSRSKVAAEGEVDRRPSNAPIILNEAMQSPEGISECATAVSNSSDSICVNVVALQEAQQGESQNEE